MQQTIFNIGDQVMTMHGAGTITDRLTSTRSGCDRYMVSVPDLGEYLCDATELQPLKTEYSVEVKVADNVVIGAIYEIRNGEKTEIARGHGHVIHQGVVGIAQAASYALRRAWQYLSPDTE